MSARLIDRWHRWGERGRRRWTLRALPQPQLSCQLPLTHRCQLWAWWSQPVKENSPSLHLKLAVSLYLAVSLPRSPPHRLFTTSTHVCGRQNLPYVAQTVLNPEQDLISRPDPPFSPALPRVPCRRSQSASTCISHAVILRPWMLHPGTPVHLFSHAQFVLWKYAGLLNPCLCRFVWGLFVPQRRQLPRGDLFWYFTTSALLKPHCCCDWPAHTGPLSPSGVQVAVAAVSHSQRSTLQGCKNNSETCNDLC